MSKHKKTRQEKKISDLRRQLNSQSTTLSSSITHSQNISPKSPIPSYSLDQKNTLPEKIHSSKSYSDNLLQSDSTFIYRDLRKTLFLSVCAISIELVLFSIWR